MFRKQEHRLIKQLVKKSRKTEVDINLWFKNLSKRSQAKITDYWISATIGTMLMEEGKKASEIILQNETLLGAMISGQIWLYLGTIVGTIVNEPENLPLADLKGQLNKINLVFKTKLMV